AHVIIEQPPITAEAEPRSKAEPRPDDSAVGSAESDTNPIALPVSAKSETALRAQAERLRDRLRTRPDLAIGGVAATLDGRTVFDHRAVVLGRDRAQALAALDDLAAGRPSPHL